MAQEASRSWKLASAREPYARVFRSRVARRRGRCGQRGLSRVLDRPAEGCRQRWSASSEAEPRHGARSSPTSGRQPRKLRRLDWLSMIDLITQYGLALIFANVLIQQMGLPIPVVPTLIVAGALAADGKFSASADVRGCVHRLRDQRRDLVRRRPAIRPSRDEAPVPDIAIPRFLRAASPNINFTVGAGLALVLAKFVPGCR